MKKISLFIFLAIWLNTSLAQTFVDRSSSAVTSQDARLAAKLNFYLPRLCDTTNALQGGKDTLGAVFYDKCNSKAWIRDTITSGGHRWRQMLLTGQVTANNGLSVTTAGTVQLGQSIGASGNPALLIDHTEIPGNDKFLYFHNGVFQIDADHQVDAFHPLFRVSSTSSSFLELARFEANVAEVHLKTLSPTGTVSFVITGSDDAQRLATGFDGPNNHVFISDVRNTNSATMEVNGTPIGGYTVASKNFWMGQNITPDTAVLNLYRVNTGLTSAANQMLLYGSNWGAGYNTTGGAITNRMTFLKNAAIRTSGASSLTNITLGLSAVGGQTNNALQVDSGDIVVHANFYSDAVENHCDFWQINNATLVPKQSQAHFERAIRFADTVAGTEGTSAALYGSQTYQAKGNFIIPDNQKGTGIEGGLFLRRNTTYTGAVIYQGSFLPTNNVTTMPSAMSSRLDASQVQTGSNSITTQGFFASFSATVNSNTGNTLDSVAWLNTGAGQLTAGSIKTAYALYINTLPAIATTKYSIYQTGTADTNYLAGVNRLTSLTTGNATTDSILVTNNGVVKRIENTYSSNSYSPTLTAVTNVDAVTLVSARYFRTNTNVIVYLNINIDPTAASATEVGIQLPFVSNIVAGDVIGNGDCDGVAAQNVIVTSDATNDRASVKFTATSTSQQSFYISFSFPIH